jgi:hypothetical protein
LYKADEIAAYAAAMAIEEILGGIYIERRPALAMQGTQSDKLLAIANRPRSPVEPSEILQQWHAVFERLHIAAHVWLYLERALLLRC